jgi:hypothetical protein
MGETAALSKRPFRQTEVQTAIKAAQAAKLCIARVEIDQNGKIVIVAGNPEAIIEPNFPSPNPATEIVL